MTEGTPKFDNLVGERSSIMAKIVLAISFATILSGRFSLNYLSHNLPDFDLRWLLVLIGFLAAGFWIAAEKPTLHPSVVSAALAWLLLWVLWMVLTLAWGPRTVPIGTELENLVLLGFSIVLTAIAVRRVSRQDLDMIWWLVLVAASLYLVDALGRGPGTFGRYSAFGGGPNVFVRVMVLGTFASLALSSGKGKWWTLLLAPLFAFGAVLSGSRGGVVAAVVILSLALIPILRGLGPKRSLLLAVPSAVMILLTPTLLGQDQVSVMYERFILAPLMEGDASTRDVLAERAIGLFHAHPFTGAGTGSVAAEASTGEGGLHAHNLFLATMAEGGGIGLALLAGSLITFVVNILRHRPLPSTTRFSLIAALYILGAAQFSGDYYDSRFIWFFLLIAGTSVVRVDNPGSPPSHHT